MTESRRGHEEFKARVEASFPVVEHVRSVLTRSGLEVMKPEEHPIRPYGCFNQDGYSDNGDLFVKKNGLWRRVEVKHILKKNFTSRETWPYGSVMIVDTVSGVERLKDEPLCYIDVSLDMSTWAIIPWETKIKWWDRKGQNRKKANPEMFRMCPRLYATFVSSSEKITLDMLEFTRPEERPSLFGPRSPA